jgi:hypothetical protein|tara:strand:+ start:997 stop:1179 length:183 start_codon:yes stop_codon:yes gene_type:complete
MAKKHLDSAQAEELKAKQQADEQFENNEVTSEEADPTHGHTEEGETETAVKCQNLLKNWR